MSAHKSAIVRLGEAEYQRLRDAEENLRLLQLRGTETNQTNDQLSIFNRMVSESQANEQEYREIVQDFTNTDIRSAEVETEISNWLLTQNEALQRQILFAEQNSKNWAEHIYAELAHHAKILDKKLSDREATQAEQNENQAKDTRQAIEIATRLMDYLQEEYKLDLSSANELELLRSEIEEAIFQFNAGRDQRAWSSARSAWNGLTRLRHHLEATRGAVSAYQQELVFFAEQVLDQIQQSQVVHAMDGDGNELPEEIEVDYWTDHAYSCLLKQANQAQIAVNELHDPDLNEISEWREELRLLDERAVDLITQARIAVLASQLRFNVAQIVVRALESQGFYLEEASYVQNDYRGTFTARTRSMSGSEVLVTIDPDPGLEEGGRMHIDSADAHLVSEHELLQRNSEIYEAIRHEGLQVGESKNNPASHNQSNPLKSYSMLKNKKFQS